MDNTKPAEPVFTFALTQAQLNIISEGLGELPLRKSLPLLQELQKQFDAQAVQ